MALWWPHVGLRLPVAFLWYAVGTLCSLCLCWICQESTLINRFYDIQSGVITYDGIDVKLIEKDSLRRSLGIVLQDTHLFTGTIAENIAYGRADATREEILEAARIANVDSFVQHLDNGYDTVLTDDGAGLSNGQRQLIAIARAALANAPVLILDEATSSIDSRTEKMVQEGWAGLWKDVRYSLSPTVFQPLLTLTLSWLWIMGVSLNVVTMIPLWNKVVSTTDFILAVLKLINM